MTLDNLIEELTRAKAQWEVARQVTSNALSTSPSVRLSTLLLNNVDTILSALKENKRLREGEQQAKSALYSVIAHWDEFGPEYGFSEAVDLARAALQPQGEK